MIERGEVVPFIPLVIVYTQLPVFLVKLEMNKKPFALSTKRTQDTKHSDDAWCR